MIYTYEHTQHYSVLNLLDCNVVTFQFINLRDSKWNEIWVIRCSSWIGSKIWSLFALPTSGRSPELGATSRHSANTVQRKNLRVRKISGQTNNYWHIYIWRKFPLQFIQTYQFQFWASVLLSQATVLVMLSVTAWESALAETWLKMP